MSSPSSGNALAEKLEENEESLLWLGTYCYEIKINMSKMNPGFSCKIDLVKIKYVNMCFKFELKRLSEMHFKIICYLWLIDCSIRSGKYKIVFFCDINVSDEDTKVFEMQSGESVAEASFWLNASNKQNFSPSDHKKEFQVRILVKMIEFDHVLTKRLIHYKKEFRKNNEPLYRNKTVLSALCYILSIQKFDDIFKGRPNWQSAALKSSYIRRTVAFLKDIVEILCSFHNSTVPVSTKLERILHFILHGKLGRIDHDDLLNLYIKAHFIGLNFLIYLSSVCILCRLSACQITNVSDYEKCIFDVLKTAFNVDDKHLFEDVARRLHASDKNISAKLLKKLNERTDTRFAIKPLKRIFKKLDST